MGFKGKRRSQQGFGESKRGLTNGAEAPNFQRKSGENPSWKKRAFSGLIGAFPGPIRAFSGLIPPSRAEAAEMPLKGPWPDWRLLGQAPLC